MNLLIKPKKDSQEIVSVTPHSASWRYVSFSAHRLTPGKSLTLSDDTDELCAVILHGTVSASAGDFHWDEIGERKSVFEDFAPYAVYVPPRTRLVITARTDAEIAVAGSPAQGEFPARLIEPGTMRRSTRGKPGNIRFVCDILPQDEPAESLLIVEVKTPSGNSSSYPPHKHDVDNVPIESQLEETYYHRINPPQGFIFQRVYTDSRDIDESMVVEDRNVVLVPRGYHPVVVPYGYESYYFNVMAGPKRVWHFYNDPAHEWILSAA
ncbi:MAG: 5-deoxy-glucuronate isomerase [Verrucomicrobia bacterium]|nr:5-deoxy-glucuronate isomerase [Verrucomicrobiota bacterium]